MNKEQDEFKLVRILNKYFDDTLLETLSECANEILQAGYVQTQAGEDGLVSCLVMSKIYQQNKNACDSGMLVAMQVAAKAQKALDDMEKVESIRKVFDWIDKNIGDSYDMRLPVGSYEAFKKKTLESILSQMEEE